MDGTGDHVWRDGRLAAGERGDPNARNRPGGLGHLLDEQGQTFLLTASPTWQAKQSNGASSHRPQESGEGQTTTHSKQEDLDGREGAAILLLPVRSTVRALPDNASDWPFYSQECLALSLLQGTSEPTGGKVGDGRASVLCPSTCDGASGSPGALGAGGGAAVTEDQAQAALGPDRAAPAEEVDGDCDSPTQSGPVVLADRVGDCAQLREESPPGPRTEGSGDGQGGTQSGLVGAISRRFGPEAGRAIRVAQCESALGQHPDTYRLDTIHGGPFQLARSTWEPFFWRERGWTWEQLVRDVAIHVEAAWIIWQRAGRVWELPWPFCGRE